MNRKNEIKRTVKRRTPRRNKNNHHLSLGSTLNFEEKGKSKQGIGSKEIRKGKVSTQDVEIERSTLERQLLDDGDGRRLEEVRCEHLV